MKLTCANERSEMSVKCSALLGALTHNGERTMIHARDDYNRIQDPAGLIGEDEPVFLLRAKDRTAPATLRAWAKEQRKLPDHDEEAVNLALRHAYAMEAWQARNGCKTADV